MDSMKRIMQWISVDERLPEDSCECMVALSNGQVWSAPYSAKHKSFNALDYQDDPLYAFQDVTHWMQHPAPPGKVQDEQSRKEVGIPENQIRLAEAVYDISFQFGWEYANGDYYKFGEYDSRALFDRILEWAQEFDAAFEADNLGHPIRDYLTKISEFSEAKAKEYYGG